ncbi:putative Ion channel, partial [Globisporangium splendens]
MSNLNKVYKLSAPLQGLLGKSELSRPAAVKEFWVYVKEHKLQDPADGRIIRPNQQMKDVFNVNEIKLTQVMGLLSKHLEKPSSASAIH